MLIETIRGWTAPKIWIPGIAGALLVLLLLASAALATTSYRWTGASIETSSWSDVTNWEGQHVPSGAVDTLDFPTLGVECTGTCYQTANDIDGLNIGALSFEGPYEVNELCFCSPPGAAITLGAGGLTTSGAISINTPITLNAPQTWSFSNKAYFGAAISGNEALGLDVSGGKEVNFNGGVNTGAVEIVGANAGDTGEAADENGTVWVGDADPARFGVADLNGTDMNSVSVTDAAIGSNEGVVGPLTLKGGDITFGLLLSGPKLTVHGNLDLDAASALQMMITGSPEEDTSSQILASGAVSLAGAHLNLSSRYSECDIAVGHVYTLVSAIGSLTGTFAGLPDGSTFPLPGCAAPRLSVRLNYTAHSVIATAIGPAFTWIGGEEKSVDAAGDWSHAANWVGAMAPTASSIIGMLEFSQLGNTCAPGTQVDTCYTSNNDLGGLNVEGLKLDDNDAYEIAGEQITLGSGGISASPGAGKYELAGEFGPGLHMPISLGASQIWHVEGQAGAGVASSGILLDGPLSGQGHALTVDTNNGAGLLLANDIEVGPVTIQGENTSDTGFSSRFNGGVTEYPLSSLNSSDGEPVTVKDDSLDAVGAVGPLASLGSEIAVWALSADEIRAGCYEEVPQSPGECVLPIQAGSLSLASATFDSQSNVTLVITSTQATPGIGYSRLSSTGAIHLGGASLAIDLAPTAQASPGCTLILPAGQKYTFISTTDAFAGISGTFNNAPQSGSEVALSQLEGAHSGGCSPSGQKLRIEYNTLSTPQTVTGTVLEPTTTALSVAPASPVTNEAVSLKATIAPGSQAPSGTVEFDIGGIVIPGCARQPVALTGSSYVASCDTSFAAAGSPEHLAAVFTPAAGSNLQGSVSSNTNVVVGKAPGTTTMAVSNATPLVGEVVTYTAVVTPATVGASAPSGVVRFLDGAAVVATCSAQAVTQGASSSTATCVLSYSEAGAHSITAMYLGDGNFNGSSSSPAQPVTVSANTSPSPPGGGTSGSSNESQGSGKAPGPPATPLHPLTRAQKLAKALRACAKDKLRSRRRICEAQARKRYKANPKKRVKRRGRGA